MSDSKIITKYQRDGWYIRVDGELIAGFRKEDHADLFIEAFKDAEKQQRKTTRP